MSRSGTPSIPALTIDGLDDTVTLAFIQMGIIVKI